MSDYKSDAKVSHGEKRKSMGIDVTHGPAAAKEMAGMEKQATADAGRTSTIDVTHGKAAEREMAQIEREAKADQGRDRT